MREATKKHLQLKGLKEWDKQPETYEEKRKSWHATHIIKDANILSAKEQGVIRDMDMNGKNVEVPMSQEEYMQLLHNLAIV